MEKGFSDHPAYKVPETKWVFDFSSRIVYTLPEGEQKVYRNKRKEHPNAGRAYILKRLFKRAERQMRWFVQFSVWDNPRIATIHHHVTDLVITALGLAYYGGLDLNDFHRFLEGMSPIVFNEKSIREFGLSLVRSPAFRKEVAFGLAQTAEGLSALMVAYNGAEPFRQAVLYEPIKNILTTIRRVAKDSNYQRTTFAAILTGEERKFLGLR